VFTERKTKRQFSELEIEKISGSRNRPYGGNSRIREDKKPQKVGRLNRQKCFKCLKTYGFLGSSLVKTYNLIMKLEKKFKSLQRKQDGIIKTDLDLHSIRVPQSWKKSLNPKPVIALLIMCVTAANFVWIKRLRQENLVLREKLDYMDEKVGYMDLSQSSLASSFRNIKNEFWKRGPASNSPRVSHVELTRLKNENKKIHAALDKIYKKFDENKDLKELNNFVEKNYFAKTVEPYNAESMDALRYEHRLKIKRKREALDKQKELFLSQLDLSKPQDQEKWASFQDKSKVELYKFKLALKKVEKDFRKKTYRVMNSAR